MDSGRGDRRRSAERRTQGTALFGRADEWTRLARVLESVATGRCKTVLVEGEAGIGKSHLVEELLSTARDAGYRVFVGRADQLDQMRPLAAIMEALGGSRVDIGSGTSGPDPPNEAGAEHRLIDRLVDFLERLAVDGPVVFVLEDLHWADASTIAAIRIIGRRLSYLPILLVGTYRPHPTPPELPRLLDAVTREDGATIVLHRLSDQAVAELAVDLLGADVGPGLSKVLSAASGNPLFVSELVRGLQDEGLIAYADGRADTDPGPLPPPLRLTILRRLSFLPAETTQALRAASVLGSSFALEELAALMEIPTPRVANLAEPALRSKVLTERGTGLAFRHDLIQEAIYADIPTAVRSSMHIEAAKALRTVSAPPQRIAEHLLRGANVAGENVIAMIERAISDLGYGAPVLSIELRRRLIDLVGESDARAETHLFQMLMPLTAVGRGEEALAITERLLARGPDPATEAVIRTIRFQVKARDGRIAECIPELADASSDPRVPDGVRRVTKLSLASAYAALGQVATTRKIGEAVLEEVRDAGDHRLIVMALTVAGASAAAAGYAAEGARHLEEALELDLRRRTTVPHPHATAAVGRFASDRFDEARQALLEGRRRESEMGEIPSLSAYGSLAALLEFHAGEWDDALAEAEAVLELVAEGVGTTLLLNLVWPPCIQIPLRRGDLVAAQQATRQAREWMRRGEQLHVEALGASDALCREAAGDVDGAFEVAWDAWVHAEADGELVGSRIAGPQVVRLALLRGDRDRAVTVAEAMEELARRAAGVPWAEGVALRCRGLVEDSPDTLHASVEAYGRGPGVLDRAEAAEDAAVSLAQHGRADDARTLFDEALSFYERVGAVRDSARCTGEMRAAGIRRGSRASRSRPTTGWAALTPKEREVARMAAEGLTNPQIAERLYVSKYTVMTHLSHAFGKLGISSRVELAAVATRESE